MDLMKTLLGLLARELDVVGGAPEIIRDAVRFRMESRLSSIITGMQRKGTTLEKVGSRAVIRDALFRLWRQVIPSGDLADFVRDAQDDRVLAIVQPKVIATTTLPEVVEWTLEAVLSIGV
jgi:hypothetical protein